IVCENLSALAKEPSVKINADVFEHADRDYAIVGLADVAVVLQTEINGAKALLGCPASRHRQLLVRQCDPGGVRPADFSKVGPQPAPAAANVENALVGFQQELRSEMTFFRELCVVERLVRALEIGATILAVGVKEERIKMSVEVIVMRNIAPRATTQIVLLKVP